MSQYMASVQLPQPMTEEFMELIPDQREKVDSLMKQGKIASYMLSMDYRTLWVVVNADSDENARAIIASFPIIAFIRFELNPLALYNSIRMMLPQISLN